MVIEASLYTLLLDGGYRSLLDMTEIVQRVSTFLQVRACTAADMPAENSVLAMLTRCVTLVDTDPIPRVNARWQKTLCRLGLVALSISKIWKYMPEPADNVQEGNLLMWLDLLEVVLYKNPKMQRNFIKQRGMQVLFRVVIYAATVVSSDIL